MQIKFEQIIDKHKDFPCVVTMHGPSLNNHREKIVDLENQEKIIRIDCNNWFDYFNKAPKYWVFANGELNIQDCINNAGMWRARNYSININEHKSSTILFAGSVDFSNRDFLSDTLELDYLPYDQRHFKNHRCLDILKNFRRHCEENKNFTFTDYGNNFSMFKPPRQGGGFSGAFPFGPTGGGICCKWIVDGVPTVQEKLQEVSGYSEHYSTGDTVAIHMISFAIMMGCNPIFVSGLDLDYKLGFANPNVYVPRHNDDWQNLSFNLKNDLKVLNESAKMRGIKIINLNQEPWYNVLETGELDIG